MVLIANHSSPRQMSLLASWIASTATDMLTQHSCQVLISLESASSAFLAPPPEVLQHLAPLTFSINMYPVSLQQITCDTTVYDALNSAWASPQLQALQHCSISFSTLCISEAPGSRQPTDGIARSLVYIGHLSGLIKLHLSLHDYNQPTSFQPLAQLSRLQDLALQSRNKEVSCAGILTSSRHSLRHVILTAYSWSLDTYTALRQVPDLQTILLKLYTLYPQQALELARVRARTMHMLLRHSCAPERLLALSTAMPAILIRQLTLCRLDDNSCSHLKTLPSLETLIIVKSPAFTGLSLQLHPNVTELQMADCPGINASGLGHMLKTALPALRKLTFLSWNNRSCRNHMVFSEDSMKALSYGKKLVHIDLRGVHGLTGRHVFKHRWGNLMKALLLKPHSKKLLKAAGNGCQQAWYYHDEHYCPATQLLPGKLGPVTIQTSARSPFN